jgi:hypothetical protein
MSYDKIRMVYTGNAGWITSSTAGCIRECIRHNAEAILPQQAYSRNMVWEDGVMTPVFT